MKKKFHTDADRFMAQSGVDAYKREIIIQTVKRVYQVAFRPEIAKCLTYEGKNVSLIAQIKDWRDNYSHKSPLVVEVSERELEEFMAEMKYEGESLDKGAFAALMDSREKGDRENDKEEE